ncbi:hypothetical protein ATANTOWER_014454 [Ataeniobius toweri]|uniref:Secreted protein n=1 Tax=Ataeniobius toweri TaxID=208326 RepID=A0ABU7AXX3_9TELE|nr:hypothetical protein [Ataeniobius toweri]
MQITLLILSPLFSGWWCLSPVVIGPFHHHRATGKETHACIGRKMKMDEPRLGCEHRAFLLQGKCVECIFIYPSTHPFSIPSSSIQVCGEAGAYLQWSTDKRQGTPWAGRHLRGQTTMPIT